VLEADIRACFDQIDHAALMGRVRSRITDKRVLALVKAFLKAGVMTAAGGREETPAGTPQGGILSPLLANIALSALDEHFMRQWQPGNWQRAKRRKQGLGNWRLIRYADDFVVMVSGERRHAEALREETARVLAPLGLRLAEEKTRVARIDEGFDFLGFTIRKMRKRGTSKHYVYTIPSKAAIQAAREKVSAKTYRSTRNQDPATLIAGINRFLAGWAGYYRHGVSSAVFAALDRHAWFRIVRWLRRKYHRRRSRIGMPEIRRRFCLPGTWKLTVNGVRFTGAAAVPVTRYRYRGASIPSPFTPQPTAVS
jgi:RNA-directed DNA polymerase